MNQLYIPLQNVTVTTTPTLQNIGIESQCNITVKNSTGDNLIITTTDSRGQLKSFTVYAGNSTIIKKTNAYQVSFKAETTSTTFSAVISWPDEVDPSSLTISTSGSIVSVLTSATSTFYTVPAGKQWTILRVYMMGISNGTAPMRGTALITPKNKSTNFPNLWENLAFIYQTTVASGDTFYGYGSTVGPVGATPSTPSTTQAQVWQQPQIFNAGDIIQMYIENVTSALFQIWYIETSV